MSIDSIDPSGLFSNTFFLVYRYTNSKILHLNKANGCMSNMHSIVECLFIWQVFAEFSLDCSLDEVTPCTLIRFQVKESPSSSCRMKSSRSQKSLTDLMQNSKTFWKNFERKHTTSASARVKSHLLARSTAAVTTTCLTSPYISHTSYCLHFTAGESSLRLDHCFNSSL